MIPKRNYRFRVSVRTHSELIKLLSAPLEAVFKEALVCSANDLLPPLILNDQLIGSQKETLVVPFFQAHPSTSRITCLLPPPDLLAGL